MHKTDGAMGLSEPFLLSEHLALREQVVLNLMGLSGPFLLCECLSSRKKNFSQPDGLKWTRTTDLTLIRRAL